MGLLYLYLLVYIIFVLLKQFLFLVVYNSCGHNLFFCYCIVCIYFFIVGYCNAYNKIMNVLIFAMLDTSHTVTPFNVLRSHNVAHSCDRATFNVDCCYGILQHLLRICMSAKASVTVQDMQ
jgi:hypothetical protein